MYFLYNYSQMKFKLGMFRNTYVSSTSQSYYDDYARLLTGYDSDYWKKLEARYAEDFQVALLLGMTVTGIYCYDWKNVFYDLYHEHSPFQNITKLYLQGQLDADWGYFANKMAKESSKSIHYPAVQPVWLFPFGYDQSQYLEDLSVYWDNIHDDYYKPWETTRIGQDSPEIARLKKISQEARREIDMVAKYGGQHAKR